MTANVRGTTAEERKESRRKRTAERRAAYYRGLLREANGNPGSQLRHACDYLRAIADDLTPEDVAAIAREVAELSDRWGSK